MDVQILTLLLGAGLPLLLVIAAAVLGMSRRLKLRRSIIAGIRTGRFADFASHRDAPKVRRLAALALAGTAGSLLLIFLFSTRICSKNIELLFALLALLLLVSGVSGALLFRHVTQRLR